MKDRSSKKQELESAEKTSRKTNSISLRRIMVPLDFSEPSKNALRYAVSFAKHFGAELVLVYVIEPMVYPPDFSFGQVGIPNIEKELRERGQKELGRLIQADVAGQVVARSVIRTGKPFLEIINLARKEDVDLIIIATHGHTGVEHIIFGSTAEKVVRKAPCPVLVVRSPEHEFIAES